MKVRQFALCAAVMIGLTNMVGAAVAQSKVYIINEERIRRDSKVGKEMSATLGGIREQGVEKLGLKALGDQIKTEQDALRPQTESLTKEALDKNPTLKAKVEALGKKQGEYLQKANILDANLDQQSTAFNVAFAQVLEPAVTHVAKQVGADVVLSYTSTWYVKDTVDISGKVIERLDATVPTLKALQTALQPAGAAAPAAAPAAPAKPKGGN